MKRPLSEDFIKQNLEDAGCDCDLIECILADYEASDKEEMRKRLNKHRKELLDLVHENYKKIFEQMFDPEYQGDISTEDYELDSNADTSVADYVWLPFRFDGEMGYLDWKDEWRIEEYE